MHVSRIMKEMNLPTQSDPKVITNEDRGRLSVPAPTPLASNRPIEILAQIEAINQNIDIGIDLHLKELELRNQVIENRKELKRLCTN